MRRPKVYSTKASAGSFSARMIARCAIAARQARQSQDPHSNQCVPRKAWFAGRFAIS